jgi:hypothetical protein
MKREANQFLTKGEKFRLKARIPVTNENIHLRKFKKIKRFKEFNGSIFELSNFSTF